MSEQLEQWAKGNSIHMEDQCCPDFSCCNKDMNTPIAVRERYVKAVNEGDESTKMEMLGMFLGQAMSTLNKDVYVAGLSQPTSDMKPMEHIESKDCWCEPVLIQDIDDEHDAQVWAHRGHEELNQ